MSADTVIAARGVGKKYRLGQGGTEDSYRTMRETLTRGVGDAFRRLRGRMADAQHLAAANPDLWALKDVDFDVARGEVVGIVGRNGAGKSTLLKILSRITDPSEGRITIRGRVASLLEVGTGFHQELTGRENIYLNGAILGMRRDEIRRRFDEIVAFAEVERFLDTPVKRYSSGMYMRLAFAVAAHLHSDILIVDEVLAVGDAEFQKKCLGRMTEFSNSGRTVLFVSHNIGALVQACSTGILLRGGKLALRAPMREVAQAYHATALEKGNVLSARVFSGPLRAVEFTTLDINGTSVESQLVVSPLEPVTFVFSGSSRKAVANLRFAFSLYCDGMRLLTLHDEPEALKEGAFKLAVSIPARFLRPGVYSIAAGARRTDGDEWCWGTDIASITVIEEWDEGYERDNTGIVNLSGSIRRSTREGLA